MIHCKNHDLKNTRRRVFIMFLYVYRVILYIGCIFAKYTKHMKLIVQ